jgi:hypothetical protein
MTTKEHDRAVHDRTRSLARWLVSAYFIFVGAFAGWHGKGLWTWEYALLVALIPVVVALLLALPGVLRNPYPSLLLTLLPLYLLAGAAMGGMGLAIARGVISTTGDWQDPYTRSAVAGGAMLLLALLLWVAYRPGRKGAEEGGE